MLNSFDKFCLADRSYLKNRKKVRGKFNGLNVLQILIRSVVPKSSYEGRTKSNFNIKEMGEILGDRKITLLIFRFFWLYVIKCLIWHPLLPREEKKWVSKNFWCCVI